MKYSLLLFLSVFGLAYAQEKSTQTFVNKHGVQVTISGLGDHADLIRVSANISPASVAFLDASFPPWDQDSALSPNTEISPTPSILVDSSEKIKHIAQAEQKARDAENEYAKLHIQAVQAKVVAEHMRDLVNSLKTTN